MPLDLAGTEQDLLLLLQGADVVVHLTLGSTPGVSNDNPLADFLINTIGTVRLFDVCAKAGGRGLCLLPVAARGMASLTVIRYLNPTPIVRIWPMAWAS